MRRWGWWQLCKYYMVKSSSFRFLVAWGIVLVTVSSVYAWLSLSPDVHKGLSSNGCQVDSEGSWSIGVFYGDSPFHLKPIESENTLFLFFETKNSITMQGDIAVARSTDKGATWQQLGIALDEDWHLSYPYVFNYNGQIYMMPESSKNGELCLYRAEHFPLEWTLEKVMLRRPLVDSVLFVHDGKYWILGSAIGGIGSKHNGRLEIWYSSSPLGPWKQHRKNPSYDTKFLMGARNGGRPFIYNGSLYRVGQDSGGTYGKRLRLFRIDKLTPTDFIEVEVPLGFEEQSKGRNAWNGARHHHLDVQQLSSGEWVGIMDGDRVPSGDSTYRFLLGLTSVLAVIALVTLIGTLIGALKCKIPISWCPQNLEKRNDAFPRVKSTLHSFKLRQLYCRFNRLSLYLHGKMKPNTLLRKVVLALISVLAITLMCTGVQYIFGGNGAQEPYPVNGHYSQFTLLTMTYEARLWNLKLYIWHYSRCSSVREIVVVWNKGTPPDLSDFNSAVPVRIRIEANNSLNNRFKMDPLIKTRAVLELDDDILMKCNDLERGFQVWREHPDRIVGFYPRLVDGKDFKYQGEKHARSHKGYNMILTGAAFIDTELAFNMYWSEKAKAGREIVDKYLNCEDVLLNYLYANASAFDTVEYVRPAMTLDTSKLSSVAISKDTQAHYKVRSNCLEKFEAMYGSLRNRKSHFNRRIDGWDK
nr:PREDICTED: glycosyltransferase family protein 64 protein C5 isoform X2 [Daucus carota subsp. sativus]